MTRIGLRPGGFGAIDGELMVDLGLLMADLVLLMADYLSFFGSGCCLMKFWVGGLMIFLGWFSHVGLGLMNFSCSRFDEFFMFWRFWWRIGILHEILHCSRFDCALALGLIVLGFGRTFLCS